MEVRECWSTSNPDYLNLIRDRENWLGLKSIAMVIATRILEGKETKRLRFYLSSLPGNAERLLDIIRKHWAIENDLHWVLDVAFRKDQAPQNLAVLRHIALNLLQPEKTARDGIHARQLQAGWKEDYLLKVLAAGN